MGKLHFIRDRINPGVNWGWCGIGWCGIFITDDIGPAGTSDKKEWKESSGKCNACETAYYAFLKRKGYGG